eukprot:751511-Hanusia_phi.AAC.1
MRAQQDELEAQLFCAQDKLFSSQSELAVLEDKKSQLSIQISLQNQFLSELFFEYDSFFGNLSFVCDCIEVLLDSCVYKFSHLLSVNKVQSIAIVDHQQLISDSVNEVEALRLLYQESLLHCEDVENQQEMDVAIESVDHQVEQVEQILSSFLAPWELCKFELVSSAARMQDLSTEVLSLRAQVEKQESVNNSLSSQLATLTWTLLDCKDKTEDMAEQVAIISSEMMEVQRESEELKDSLARTSNRALEFEEKYARSKKVCVVLDGQMHAVCSLVSIQLLELEVLHCNAKDAFINMKYREGNLIDCLRQATRESDMYKKRNQELLDEMRVKEDSIQELKDQVHREDPGGSCRQTPQALRGHRTHSGALYDQGPSESLEPRGPEDAARISPKRRRGPAASDEAQGRCGVGHDGAALHVQAGHHGEVCQLAVCAAGVSEHEGPARDPDAGPAKVNHPPCMPRLNLHCRCQQRSVRIESENSAIKQELGCFRRQAAARMLQDKSLEFY